MSDVVRICMECGADGAKLHCGHCKVCYYCSKACQRRNWGLHKHVCTTDPSLRRFVPVEMAIERSLLKQPKVQAPKDATCYICLEGEDATGKLMRGCACRGDSAGYAHIECLTELAMSKEATGDKQAVFSVYMTCGNCKHNFTGALELVMTRRFWPHYRSSHDQSFQFNATRSLAYRLEQNGEQAASNDLYNEASKFTRSKSARLDVQLHRANLMATNGKKLEAVELLQAMLPEANAGAVDPCLYVRIRLTLGFSLVSLRRFQEYLDIATELITFTKANCGPESMYTLKAKQHYAAACAWVGRLEESKLLFEDLLATEIRVLGHEHPDTVEVVQWMYKFGFVTAHPQGYGINLDKKHMD